jgi:hypothetical protein
LLNKSFFSALESVGLERHHNMFQTLDIDCVDLQDMSEAELFSLGLSEDEARQLAIAVVKVCVALLCQSLPFSSWDSSVVVLSFSLLTVFFFFFAQCLASKHNDDQPGYDPDPAITSTAAVAPVSTTSAATTTTADDVEGVTWEGPGLDPRVSGFLARLGLSELEGRESRTACALASSALVACLHFCAVFF